MLAGRVAMEKKLKRYFSKLGKKGAKTRMQKLTPEQRTRIARAAAKTRWAQEKRGGSC
jgi:hypothetical protein